MAAVLLKFIKSFIAFVLWSRVAFVHYISAYMTLGSGLGVGGRKGFLLGLF